MIITIEYNNDNCSKSCNQMNNLEWNKVTNTVPCINGLKRPKQVLLDERKWANKDD